MARLGLLILGLLLLWHTSDAAPVVTDISYALKSASVQQVELDVATFRASFNECSYNPCTPTACICDYASQGASCGSPVGGACSCNTSLCNATTNEPWVSLTVGSRYQGFLIVWQTEIVTGTTLRFRIFVNSTYGCSGIQVSARALYGDPDIAYISSRGPDYFDDPQSVRWVSVNSGRDDTTICPSDYLYLSGGGTYFGEIYAFQTTGLILEILPVDTSGIPVTAGVPPGTCPVGVTCLAPDADNVYPLNPEDILNVQAHVPCIGAPTAASFFITVDSNTAGVVVSFFTLNATKWPIAIAPENVTSDVFLRSDFPAQRFQTPLAACTTGYTAIYITFYNPVPIAGNLPSDILVRFTYNNNAAVPITTVADTDYDFGHAIAGYVSITCGSTYVPPCPRFYTDDYCRVPNSPRDSAIALQQPVPAYSAENILWPPFSWLYYVKRSGAVTDGTLHAAVQGGAGVGLELNSNPATPVNSTQFAVSLILGAKYTQNGLSTQEIYVNDVTTCRLSFNGLTGASGGLITNSVVPHENTPPCDPDRFNQQRGVVLGYIQQLQNNTITIDDVGVINSQLDVLNFLDSWLGCVKYTESLFSRQVVASFLPQSAICSPSLDPNADTDPCCSLDLLWESCCVPERRAAVLSVPTYILPDESVLSQSCSSLTCAESYLSSFAAVQRGNVDFSKGCSGVSQSIGKFFRNKLNFWKECGEKVFGDYEQGQSCNADSDCSAGGVCDLFSHSCVATPDALTNAFLACFVQNADPFILTTLNASLTSTGDLVADLRAAFTTADCLPYTGVDFNVQSHWTWSSFGCPSLCNIDYPFHYKVGQPPLACAFTGFGLDVCQADPLWLAPGDSGNPVLDQTQCAAVATRSTSSAGTPTGNQFCAACFGNSPFCYDAAVALGVCNSTAMCMHPGPFQTSFTTTNATSCADTLKCSVACYNASGFQVECADQALCEASGSCSSDAVFDAIGNETACVLPPGKYFIPPDRCQDLYGILGEDRIIAMGCVSSAYLNQTACDAAGGKWIYRAQNATACAAAGCGCDTVSPLDLDETTPYSFLTPPNPAGCGSCGTQCVDYFTWTPGRWLPFTAVQLRVVNSQQLPIATWKTGTFDWTQLGEATEAALSTQFALQIAAEQQCRFNQLAASVTGVTCSCPLAGSLNSTAARECLISTNSALSDAIPLGVAAPCGGGSTSVQATPFSLVFQPTSLPSGVCSAISVTTLPRENFRNPPPVNPTSTFIKGRTPKEFEFTNRKGQPIVADGFTVIVTGIATPQSVFACLPFSPPGAGGADKDFNLLAIAVQIPSGRIEPANNASIPLIAASPLYNGDTTLSLCAEVTIPAGARSFSVLPVTVDPGWHDKPKRIFEGGSSAIIFFTAFCYLAALLYALWIIFSMLWRSDYSYTAHIVWPIGLFFAARMLYFMLLGAEVFGGRDINTGEYFLTDLPINLYISCLVYLVLFWILTVASSLGKFYPSVIIFNVILYLIFLAFVLLFEFLPKDKVPTAPLQCLLGSREKWPPRRIVSATYKGFLALLCIIIASLFAWFGRRIYSWLRKVEDLTMDKSGSGSVMDIVPPSKRILVISIYNIVSLIVTAVLLVVSNVVSWRSNYFACIIAWFFDMIPLLLLLWVINSKDKSHDEEAPKPKAFATMSPNNDAGQSEAQPVGPTAVKLKSWDGDSSSSSLKKGEPPEFVPEGERELQRFDSGKDHGQRFDTNSLAPHIGGDQSLAPNNSFSNAPPVATVPAAVPKPVEPAKPALAPAPAPAKPAAPIAKNDNASASSRSSRSRSDSSASSSSSSSSVTSSSGSRSSSGGK